MSVLTAALKSLEQAVVFFEKDLEALSEEQILNAPMGSARKPVDFVYETALVNLQIRARIVGETPPQGVEDGWEVAPAELCSKAAIAAYYKSSSDALLESIRSIPVTDGDRLIPALGEIDPCLKLCISLVCTTCITTPS